MSASRKRRSLLREVNEQIRNITASFALHDSTFLVVCECEQPGCVERVRVPMVVYDELRGDRERFVVVTGHENTTIERITASDDGYAVVRALRHHVQAVPLPAA